MIDHRPQGRLVRDGKVKAEAADERLGEVRPVNSTDEADEQNGETRSGAGGGK